MPRTYTSYDTQDPNEECYNCHLPHRDCECECFDSYLPWEKEYPEDGLILRKLNDASVDIEGLPDEVATVLRKAAVLIDNLHTNAAELLGLAHEGWNSLILTEGSSNKEAEWTQFEEIQTYFGRLSERFKKCQ